VFESILANKAFFQWSTYLTALFQAFAAKGFTTSDSNLSTLTAQCANFLTTADVKPTQVRVTYSPTPVFDGSAASSIRMDITGNVTSSTLVNIPPPGTILTFYIVSASPGSFSFAWPTNVFNARNVKTQSDGNLFTQQFISDGGNFYAVETFLAVVNTLVNTAQSSANTALAQIAALNFNATLAGNGSQSLPSGLVIKWATGTVDHGSSSDPTQTVNFAAGFPNTCFAAFVSTNIIGTPVDGDIQMYSVTAFTTSGITVHRMRRGDESTDYVTSPTVFAIGR
jgi:hypothetical protein